MSFIANFSNSPSYPQRGLREAVWDGNLSRVERYLSRGVDPKVRYKGQESLLHTAAWEGRDSIAKILIQRGCPVHAIDSEKVTPLHCASIRGHAQTMRVLIENGASVTAEDSRRQDPFYWAAYCGNVKALQILKRHHPAYDVNKKDHHGKTALRAAAKYGYVAVIHELMGHGADANIVDDKRGWTPLHVAAHRGNFFAMCALKEWGARELRDKNGMLPSDIAKKAGWQAKIRYWSQVSLHHLKQIYPLFLAAVLFSVIIVKNGGLKLKQ